MIRLVLAFAVPIAVAAAAAFLAGPSTLGFAGGEPMLVASSERLAALQAVSHHGCPPTIATGAAVKGETQSLASIRIIKLGPAGAESLPLAEVPIAGAPGTQIVLVVDGDGRLLAAGDASPSVVGPASEHDCDGPEETATPGII